MAPSSRSSQRFGPVLAGCTAGCLLLVSAVGCRTPAAGNKPAAAATAPNTPATVTAGTVDPANRWKVTASSASFYKLGPQQPSGPDLALKQGARVTLTRRGFGFSQVLLEDGTAGFVGTEDIARLTPEEIAAENKPPVTLAAANVRGVGNNPAKPGTAAARRRPGRPGPSLPIIPGDEPNLPAAPDPTPRTGPVPTFRY